MHDRENEGSGAPGARRIGREPTDVLGAERFGASLRLLRRRAGLSQKELADFSTLSVRAIRDLELGKVQRPRRETLQLLTRSLDLSADQITSLESLVLGAPPEASLVEMSGWDAFRPPLIETPLIGRDNELGALIRAFREGERRRITLTGIARVGKTRLALEAARILHEQEQWSVLWLPGEDHSGYGQRPAATRMRRLLTATEYGADRLGRLIDDSPTLLVLDSWEERGPGLAVVDRLLATRAQLRVLVTTRDTPSLSMSACPPFSVAPLTLPCAAPADAAALARFPSVRLLLNCLQEGRPSFRPNAENVASVAEVCRLLDGLPGALESAARWCLVYSPQQLARQLAADPFMAADPPGAGAERGPGIRASVCRATDSLTPVQRMLLATVADMGGFWSMADAAQAVGADVTEVAHDIYVLLLNGLLHRADETDRSLFQVLNGVRHVIGQQPVRRAEGPRHTGRLRVPTSEEAS